MIKKDLLKGLRWLLITMAILIFLIGLWIVFSWSIGWVINSFFDLENFGPKNYISLGSIILVFNLVMQILTVVVTAWALVSWGKARGLHNNTTKKSG